MPGEHDNRRPARGNLGQLGQQQADRARAQRAVIRDNMAEAANRIPPRPEPQDLFNAAQAMWADQRWAIQGGNQPLMREIGINDVPHPDVNNLDFIIDDFLNPKKPKMNVDESKTTITELYGLGPPKKITKLMETYPKDIIKGIELEIEHFPERREEAVCAGFTFVEDGSLRNNGVEAVSHPMPTANLLACVRTLWEKYGISEKNFSDRTSIHVHANVCDFTIDQYKVLTLLYQVFEELLFDYVGNEREDNIYCCPWYQAGLSHGRHKSMHESPHVWEKYTALNLIPTREKGTVEFRHMHGHANFTLLEGWLHIIDDLMQSAKTSSYAEVLDTIKSINTNSQYMKFLHSVFPVSANILKSQNWEAKLARGVIEAKIAMV